MLAQFQGMLQSATPSTGRAPVLPAGHYRVIAKTAEDKPAKPKDGQEPGMNCVIGLQVDPSTGKSGQLTMYLPYPVPGQLLSSAAADRWAGFYLYLKGYSPQQYKALVADDPLANTVGRTAHVRVWVTESKQQDARTGEQKVYTNNEFVLISAEEYGKGCLEDARLAEATKLAEAGHPPGPNVQQQQPNVQVPAQPPAAHAPYQPAPQYPAQQQWQQSGPGPQQGQQQQNPWQQQANPWQQQPQGGQWQGGPGSQQQPMQPQNGLPPVPGA